MREELAMNKVKYVAELYILADRYTRAEEGRKYPGEDASAETDSTDEETAAPTKKDRRRNHETQGQDRACRRGIRRPRRRQEGQG